MIPRWNVLLWLALFVASASGLYMVKYRVQALQLEVAKTTKDLERERESLRVVEAEWAYLSRPERLQRLSARFLQLQPVQPRQIAGANSLGQPVAEGAKPGLTPAAAHISPQVQPAEGE